MIARPLITVVVEHSTHCDVVRMPVHLYSTFVYHAYRSSHNCRIWIGGNAELPAYTIRERGQPCNAS